MINSESFAEALKKPFNFSGVKVLDPPVLLRHRLPLTEESRRCVLCELGVPFSDRKANRPMLSTLNRDTDKLEEFPVDRSPAPIEEPHMVSPRIEGILNRLSPRQRQRFWTSFRHCENEKKALNIARSSPA